MSGSVGSAGPSLLQILGINHPGNVPGGVYPCCASVSSGAAAPGATGTVYFMPFLVYFNCLPVSFGVRVSALGAGSSFKIGVWNPDPANGLKPAGLPIMSNNTGVATTSNNTTAMATITGVYLNMGRLVWVGAKFTGTLPTVIQTNTSGLEGARFLGLGAASTGGGFTAGYSIADAYANDISALNVVPGSLATIANNADIAYFFGT